MLFLHLVCEEAAKEKERKKGPPVDFSCLVGPPSFG